MTSLDYQRHIKQGVLTSSVIRIIIRQQVQGGDDMTPRFEIGQKVTVKPVDSQQLTQRDSTLDEYAGQFGEVIDYYWISPRDSVVFYIYKIRVGAGHKEIALHEDEIEAYIG